MVISKETAVLRYYELRDNADHQQAVEALAAEIGSDVETVEQALAEEVGA